MSEIFRLSVPAWDIILRTALVYLALLLGLRLAGKREIGQMTILDLIVLLLIANAVQNAMVGADSSLTGGILAAAVLLLLNALLAWLRLRFPALRKWVEGSPTLLILHGQLFNGNLRREGIDIETLETALREHGILDSKDVEMAVLEIDGTISVVQVGDHTLRTRKVSRFLKK
jgi:uncharacterized membrane protein YcaP (DUF421 family)